MYPKRYNLKPLFVCVRTRKLCITCTPNTYIIGLYAKVHFCESIPQVFILFTHFYLAYYTHFHETGLVWIWIFGAKPLSLRMCNLCLCHKEAIVTGHMAVQTHWSNGHSRLWSLMVNYRPYGQMVTIWSTIKTSQWAHSALVSFPTSTFFKFKLILTVKKMWGSQVNRVNRK